jgi:WD40 repeat protein
MGDDDKLELVDMSTRAVIRTLPAQVGQLEYAEFSGNGKRLAVVHQFLHGPIIYDVETGAQWGACQGQSTGARQEQFKGVCEGQSAVCSMALSPDGRTVAVGPKHEPGIVFFYETEFGNLIGTARTKRRPSHDDGVYSLAFANDGASLFLLCRDGVRQLRADPNERPVVLDGHAFDVVHVAASSTGELISSASWQGKVVRVWDVDSGAEVTAIREDRPDYYPVMSEFLPDGRSLAVAIRCRRDDVAMFRIWDLESRQESQVFECGPHVESFAVARGQGLLAAASFSEKKSPDALCAVAVWDVRETGIHSRMRGHVGGVFGLAFSADGRYLASSGLDGVRIWSVASGNMTKHFELEPPFRAKELRFAHGSSQLALAGGVIGRDGQKNGADTTDPGQVALYDTRTGRELWRRAEPMGFVLSLAVDTQANRLVHGAYNGPIKLLDLATGEELGTLRGHGGTEIHTLAIIPKKNLLVSGGEDYRVRLWPLNRPRAVSNDEGPADGIKAAGR